MRSRRSRAMRESVSRIDVEYGLGLGLVAGLGIVAREAEQVMHPARRRAHEFAFEGEPVAITAGKLEHGSSPARARMAAAIGADMWARALAPSVTLTASTRPASGSALSRRSCALHETGGVISAVMTNLARRSAAPSSEACEWGPCVVRI